MIGKYVFAYVPIFNQDGSPVMITTKDDDGNESTTQYYAHRRFKVLYIGTITEVKEDPYLGNHMAINTVMYLQDTMTNTIVMMDPLVVQFEERAEAGIISELIDQMEFDGVLTDKAHEWLIKRIKANPSVSDHADRSISMNDQIE